MVGVQDEQQIECLLHDRIGLVLPLGHLEHHVEEVPREAQLVVGIGVGDPPAVPVGEGRHGRHLGDQPMRLRLLRLGVSYNFV